MTTATSVRNAPLHFWRIAEAFLHVLHDLFGAPEDVARQHTFVRAQYKLLNDWLRAGEALLRKLLLMEAAAYPKPNTRPILSRHSHLIARQRTRHMLSFTHDKPEEWRVSFRCFLGPPASRRQSVPKRPTLAQNETAYAGETPAVQGLPAFNSAWPLAERYEALIRVFNDPAPYARRLARRLHALPQRARNVLRHPPNAANLVGPIAFDDLSCASDATRAEIFPDTS